MQLLSNLLRALRAQALAFARLTFVSAVTVSMTCATLVWAQDESDEEDADDIEATEREDPVTELEDPVVIPAIPIEEVVVTGSRLQRSPGELASQVIVFDSEDIRNSGEVSIERVLRQLPQNLNPTTERYGQSLNNSTNATGASTVNLRGLGSESTLILVDGKRIGHNGLIGGVTDVSSIPLQMVERIEVVLDGASAIYGSDAVGGVINVITRKDYEGVEVDLTVDWPNDGGYDERRVAVQTSQNVGGFRLLGGISNTNHSGLDASDRDVTLFDQSIFAGPQDSVRLCCLGDGSALPILYNLGGDILTFAEYQALSDDDKARATAIYDAILPVGFNQDSSVDDITEFTAPSWGAAVQDGYSVLPETKRLGYFAGISRDFSEALSMAFQIRSESRDTSTIRGYNGLTGTTFRGNNPFNPIARNVQLLGQRRDLPRPTTQSESDIIDVRFDFSGALSDSWDWEFSHSRNQEDLEVQRINQLDRETLALGLNSDGVTPKTVFLTGETAESCAEKGGSLSFGRCRVQEPADPAINPFGDLSPYVSTSPLFATSDNQQSKTEFLIRGRLFDMPAGTVRAVGGASWQSVSLDTTTQFQIGFAGETPIGDIESLNTESSRENNAIYGEILFPLVSENMGMALADSVSLSVSARRDSYEKPKATYIADDGSTEDEQFQAPGSETTHGIGIVWNIVEPITLRVNRQTAFVAPQLNQLLRKPEERTASGFSGLLIQNPDGSLSFASALVQEGGNPSLVPETAESSNVGIELSPTFAPNFVFKATRSSIAYENRIQQLSAFIIDPNNPPSHTMYDEENDIWLQERRWINVAEVDRTGNDFEILYNLATDSGTFDFQLRRSTTTKYDIVIDPAQDPTKISVVGSADSRTIVGAVSKNADSMRFTWSDRGMNVAWDISQRSKTSVTIGGVTGSYEPPSLHNLTLSYDIVPNGLLPIPATGIFEGSRLTFTMNNLFDNYGESKTTNDSGMELEQTSPDRSPLYGRVFSFSASFSI